MDWVGLANNFFPGYAKVLVFIFLKEGETLALRHLIFLLHLFVPFLSYAKNCLFD